MNLSKLNKVGLCGFGISIIALARNHENMLSMIFCVIAGLLFLSMFLAKRRV